MLSARRALTLVEVCIAIALGGVVLCLVTAIGARERRLHAALARTMAGARQLRHAAEILPIDLRALDARAGDIAPGEARDTSIQIRATIAAGVICAVSGSEISLVPAASRGGGLYSALALPRPGDTLWALADGDSSDRWIPVGIQTVREASGRCVGSDAFPSASADDAVLASLVLALSTDPPASGIRAGSPVRITRPARYSVYRASDGRWYLGYRDAAPGGGFDVVQPVSGPYAARGGVRFRYLDAAAATLAPPVDSTSRIAAVEIAVVAEAGDAGLAISGSRLGVGTRTESLAVFVALRNAP